MFIQEFGIDSLQYGWIVFFISVLLVKMVLLVVFAILLSHVYFEVSVMGVGICFFGGNITVDNGKRVDWFRADIFEMVWMDDFWGKLSE